MTQETPQKRAPMRTGLRILLIGSLAVNLIIFGLALGAVVGKTKDGPRAPRDADFMGAYTRALPDADRRAIGRDIRKHHRASGIRREMGRDTFETLLQTLRTSPFDAQALEDGLTKQAQIGFERRNAAQKIWLDHVAGMTDAERASYADDIEQLLQRKGKPKGPKPGAGQ